MTLDRQSVRPSGVRGVQFSDDVKQEQVQTEELVVNQSGRAEHLSNQLLQELDELSPPLSEHDKAAIARALDSVLSFCQSCVKSAGCSSEKADDRLFPLGAWAAGVLQPSDEVDVLFIAPESMQLPAFRSALCHVLERTAARSIANPGPDGALSAPGVRFEIQGIRVNLLLSQKIDGLPLPTGSIVVDNMAGMFARDVWDRILLGVHNRHRFKSLLRLVRCWAKQRGLYGGWLGFPTGTAWAICCAKVCLQYPNAELAQAVSHFFKMLNKWDWRQPLALNMTKATTSKRIPVEQKSENQPLMNIVLPVGTGVSATRGTTKTTMVILQKELRRGCKILHQMESMRSDWEDLLKTSNFFGRHRHYLAFEIMAYDESVFISWRQWCREKVHMVGELFEQICAKMITLRPWPEMIDFHHKDWPHATAIFFGMHLERSSGETQQSSHQRTFDLREPIVKLLEAMSAWPGAERNTYRFELLVKHVRLAELEVWMSDRENKQTARSSGDVGTSMQSVAAGALAIGEIALVVPEDEKELQQCSL